MIVKCTNKLCEYKWDYKGNAMFYATCPRCLSKVNVKKQRLINKLNDEANEKKEFNKFIHDDSNDFAVI